MIINMAGGGAALNFKVVCNPSKPTNPKGNIVWVNSDIEMTSYVVDAVEPVNPVEGMVWLFYSVPSTVAFNVLKKNCIQIYLRSAKQYVSGAWVDKPTECYQDDKWVALFSGTYLYNKGDTCNNLTGGFSKVSEDSDWWSGGSYEFNEDHIRLYTIGAKRIIVLSTKSQIDLTDIDQIVMVVESFTAAETASMSLAVSTSKSDYKKFTEDAVASADVAAPYSGTVALDVSELSGLYYVGIQENSTTGTSEAKVTEVWMA